MTDQATLLREYARALDKANSPYALRNAEARFWGKRGGAIDNAMLSPMAELLKSHTARVTGFGSPALCDQALQAALRSIVGQ